MIGNVKVCMWMPCLTHQLHRDRFPCFSEMHKNVNICITAPLKDWLGLLGETKLLASLSPAGWPAASWDVSESALTGTEFALRKHLETDNHYYIHVTLACVVCSWRPSSELNTDQPTTQGRTQNTHIQEDEVQHTHMKQSTTAHHIEQPLYLYSCTHWDNKCHDNYDGLSEWHLAIFSHFRLFENTWLLQVPE